MLLSELVAGRRVVFVGGKGGVGKTSVASALALARARAGARVLLVSTDPAHNLGHLWERSVGDEPTRLATPVEDSEGQVDGLEIDPARVAEQHLAAVRETMLRLLPGRLHRQADRHLELARAAPGTHESAVLDRIAEVVEVGAERYDLVLFDTAPSGHTVRLMALPEQLTSWTESLLANRDRSERFAAAMRGITRTRDEEPATGQDTDAELRRILVRRRRRFAHLRDVITGTAQEGRAAFVIVLQAEPLPVAETVEVSEQLTGSGVDVAALVANRRSPADAGALLATRRLGEDRQLDVVKQRLPGVPLLELPLISGDLVGESTVAQLAAYL